MFADVLVTAGPDIARVVLHGRTGFTTMEPDDLARFVPIVDVPATPYRILDVDPGEAYLNVTPDDALAAIVAAGRSPLTLEEGLAYVTQFPDVLEEHRFSLLGSRCGDRRVTAIWVSEKRPRLGWCWAGNPHTWLGSASCAGRQYVRSTSMVTADRED